MEDDDEYSIPSSSHPSTSADVGDGYLNDTRYCQLIYRYIALQYRYQVSVVPNTIRDLTVLDTVTTTDTGIHYQHPNSHSLFGKSLSGNIMCNDL